MKKIINNGEVDLAEVVNSIWINKLQIIGIILIFCLLTLSSYIISPPKFKVTTEIRPITIFEEQPYKYFNYSVDALDADDNKKFYKINSSVLSKAFIEKIKDKKFFIDAIKKFKLVKRENYTNEFEYHDAIERLALTIRINPPIKIKNKNNKTFKDIKYWTINFTTNDKKNWENVLLHVETKTNNFLKNYFINDFENSIKIEKQKKKFQIQRIETKINNSKNDYETLTKNKIEFLMEQAALARQLDIKKSTLDVSSFSTSAGTISNVQFENPYYMRGYEMIEKEIELIKSRKNKDSFMKDLFDLTIQKRSLEDNTVLEHLELLFSKSPIKNSKDFIGANIIYKNSDFESNREMSTMLILACLIGGVFGIFFVLIKDKIKQRKSN